nr:hypothetical protein [Psychrobacter sp. PraFG1]UNK05515.1 hypothetical protein MN210_00900 [Psychrobacter sp. PraFG1]
MEKDQSDSEVYTSVKHRSGKIFKSTTVGASSRGSIESDLIRFKIMWGFAAIFW